MTWCASRVAAGQKGVNMVAILEFGVAAEDALEEDGTMSGCVLRGIRKVGGIGSTSVADFALDYINTMYHH